MSFILILALLIRFPPDDKSNSNLSAPGDGCASQAWRGNFAEARAFFKMKHALPLKSITDKQKARFWSRVVKSEDPHGCWDWTGYRRGNYGRLELNGHKHGAHKISYVIHFGPVPPKKCVLHKCDNPPCCNPKHLRLGTQLQNVEDMFKKGRDHHASGPFSKERLLAAARGERNAGAKLKEGQVLELRKLHRSGFRPTDLAPQFGISNVQFWNIVSRRCWRHI